MVSACESASSISFALFLHRISEAAIEIELTSATLTILLMEDVAEINIWVGTHGVGQLVSTPPEFPNVSTALVVLIGIATFIYGCQLLVAAD